MVEMEVRRMFVSPAVLGLLVMATADSQIAEEELEVAEANATASAERVMDAHRMLEEEHREYIGMVTKELMTIFGVDKKISVIRAIRAIFDLGLREAKGMVDMVDEVLRVESPMLYSKEKVKDVEKASARLEKAQLNVARWASEHREELDTLMRAADPRECDLGPQCADELNNLFVEWDAAGEALAGTIRRKV